MKLGKLGKTRNMPSFMQQNQRVICACKTGQCLVLDALEKTFKNNALNWATRQPPKGGSNSLRYSPQGANAPAQNSAEGRVAHA